jgi:hypothetical protein
MAIYFQIVYPPSPKITSLAFSLTINVGITGKAPGVLGNTLASTTLKLLTPLTRNSESKTAIGSPSAPIEQVLVA